MQAEPLSYIEETRAFLAANGATIFADRWLIPHLYATEGSASPTMILAPSDQSLQNLLKETGKTWTAFLASPAGLDILRNHLSVTATKREWPMITSINGRAYGREQADIQALQPGASIVLRPSNFPNSLKSPLVILVITRVLVHADQLANLQIPLLRGNEIPRMGKDIFMKMITDQSIEGLDLLNLCNASDEIGALCNRDEQALFKRLLRQEFNFNYGRGFATETPRELYAKFHTMRIEVYSFNSRRGVGELDSRKLDYNYLVVKNKRVSTPIIDEIRRSAEIIHVPLEGWFVENSLKPVALFGRVFTVTEETYRRARQPVYLIYVKGKPETATLFRRNPQNHWNQAETTFTASNPWLLSYFGNRQLTITNPEFGGDTSIENVVTRLLSIQEIVYRVGVLNREGNEYIMAVQLANNELVPM